jgi:O-antigen biosynthesis protein
MTASDLDVIVPFHGRVDLLTRCLESLARNNSIGGSVYVVDDASQGGMDARTRRAVGELRLPIRWLTLETRHGFTGAVNVAWEQCRAGVVLVLNNDVLLPPNLVRRLDEAFSSDERIAAAAPTSDNPVDLFQYRSSPAHRGSTEVDYLTAMCIGVRRAAVGPGPLFDPGFGPGYFEDLDLCCRFRSRGWTLAVLEDCRASHLGRATFGDLPHLEWLVLRNYDLFFARWGQLPSHPELDRLLWCRMTPCH